MFKAKSKTKSRSSFFLFLFLLFSQLQGSLCFLCNPWMQANVKGTGQTTDEDYWGPRAGYGGKREAMTPLSISPTHTPCAAQEAVTHTWPLYSKCVWGTQQFDEFQCSESSKYCSDPILPSALMSGDVLQPSVSLPLIDLYHFLFPLFCLMAWSGLNLLRIKHAFTCEF